MRGANRKIPWRRRSTERTIQARRCATVLGGGAGATRPGLVRPGRYLGDLTDGDCGGDGVQWPLLGSRCICPAHFASLAVCDVCLCVRLCFVATSCEGEEQHRHYNNSNLHTNTHTHTHSVFLKFLISLPGCLDGFVWVGIGLNID